MKDSAYASDDHIQICDLQEREEDSELV
jgi:hypothetical protein